MAYHVWQATERVRTESRLLVDAFLNRGRLKFQDLEPSTTVGWAVESGVHPGIVQFHDRSVPGSHLVCEVRTMTRTGEGVVGIQLVMKAGGTRTEELALHGSPAGESGSTRAHSFTVDAPVERLCRFECEHNNGLIERLRMVTSGGRISPWFGDRLTAIPSFSLLPEWRHDSLAATTAAAAAAARANLSDSSYSTDGDRREAAMITAAEATAAEAAAPTWDPQKEYVTGLLGTKTHDRLMGLGVVTRHVTNSHVFSYLWEAPEEDGFAIPTPSPETAELEEVSTDKRSSPSLPSTTSPQSSACSQTAPPGSCQPTTSTSPPALSFSPDPLTASKLADSSLSSPRGLDVAIKDGGGDSVPQSEAGDSSAVTPLLSRAEAKRQKFAKEMRDKEKKKAEREHIAKQREENLERLMRGGKLAEESAQSDPNASHGVPGSPTPQEEFACLLRMRRTDARCALERSLALARTARRYRGGFGNDRKVCALNSLSAVMGLTTWFYAALLPQLVPLPVPAATTSELFHHGETALMAARGTKMRGENFLRRAQNLADERQQSPRRGVMSPAQRAREMQEREVCMYVFACARPETSASHAEYPSTVFLTSN